MVLDQARLLDKYRLSLAGTVKQREGCALYPLVGEIVGNSAAIDDDSLEGVGYLFIEGFRPVHSQAVVGTDLAKIGAVSVARHQCQVTAQGMAGEVQRLLQPAVDIQPRGGEKIADVVALVKKLFQGSIGVSQQCQSVGDQIDPGELHFGATEGHREGAGGALLENRGGEAVQMFWVVVDDEFRLGAQEHFFDLCIT